jgi:cell division protein FtsQ
MKRPPGVPQAPRSSSAREPDKTGTRSSAAPKADRAAPVRPPAPRSEPDATTEPITLPAPQKRRTTPAATSNGRDTPTRAKPVADKPVADKPAAARPIADKPGADKPAADKPVPNRTPGLLARLGARRMPSTGSDPAQADSAAPAAPLTARAARKRLRAARRARKQYERSEVRRFTSRSRRRRNLWIAAGTTVAVLVAFVLVGVYSPLMALRTIEVTGTARILPADIVTALDGQLGTPLPLIDFDEVKSELSEFSLIRSYVTESRPPDTLVVRIVEREPVGTVASAAGFDLVDAAGVVITSGAERTAGYPVIDAAGGASGAGFPAAVAVIAALPEGIRGQLDTVTAATKDDVTLTLVGGARVVWGNSERAEYKAVVLAALLVSHPVGSVTEYDVTSPDSAVVR